MALWFHPAKIEYDVVSMVQKVLNNFHCAYDVTATDASGNEEVIGLVQEMRLNDNIAAAI